jgi:hypothetical protein
MQSTGDKILTMNLAPEDAFASAASKVSPPTLSQYLDTKTHYQSQTDKRYKWKTDTSTGPSFPNISLVDAVL